MNKEELVRAVASEAGVPLERAGRVLDAFLAVVAGAMAAGDPVKVVGFGTFEARARAPRLGRNPRTGECVRIPARRVPAFRPGKPLCDAVERG